MDKEELKKDTDTKLASDNETKSQELEKIWKQKTNDENLENQKSEERN